MAELRRHRDTELREAREVLGREALRVLDPRSQSAPHVSRPLEGVERVAVREITDRVHGDRHPGGGAPTDDLLELRARRDLDA